MNLRKLWKRIRSEFLAWVERNIVADDPEDAALPSADPAPADPAPSAKPWRHCRLSSHWAGSNASKRMRNLLSPKCSAAKVKEYLDWQQERGCDHVHLLMVNQADGEGAGYDCIADDSSRSLALTRVREIRSRGLGVVAWIVADDSDSYRSRIFGDPARYAQALAEFFPYLSYICLGLEMDEGEGSASKWKSLRDAVRAAGWTGPIATHHTSGKSTHAGLGSIIMDQLDTKCTASEIKSSVKNLRSRGLDVCGFEYSRDPDRARAQAALDAGAFGCGNWDGGPESSSVVATDAPSIEWRYGGFDGSKAQEDPDTQISDLRIGSDGLSYKWAKGNLGNWGLARTDASAIAAAFWWDGSRWIGGKFDWISTSRTTRDFKNIQEGYNGWNAQAFLNAKRRAFCIVSKDGKKRTNRIED